MANVWQSIGEWMMGEHAFLLVSGEGVPVGVLRLEAGQAEWLHGAMEKRRDKR